VARGCKATKNMNNVYILLSEKDHKSYVGSTDNLARRLTEHEKGRCSSTKYRRPLKLIYTESFDELGEARKREDFLKTKQGRRELKKIFDRLDL
jgi:putative endonuclease